MYGSTVSQITDQSNGQPVYFPQFFPDSVKVEERLGWMFLRSGARIDDRDGSKFRSHTSRAFQWMPNHQHVSVLLSNADSVCEILALLYGCTLGLCESECCPA